MKNGKTEKRRNEETEKRRNLKSIRIGEKREIEEKAEKWKHGKGENDDKRINRKTTEIGITMKNRKNDETIRKKSGKKNTTK